MPLLRRCAILCLVALTCSSLRAADSLRLDAEKHLRNIRQLTNGGENAEAYFSTHYDRLVFQSTHPPYECDQIFTMDLAGGTRSMVSTGRGRTTCAYYLPGDSTILYASTHADDPACPPRPDYSKGYVWAVYPGYDIFLAGSNGNILRQLTSTPGYDAEATVSPVGDRIVFTSVRDGDLDVYTMNLDGTGVHRLTNDVGYDGGAFFSWDGKRIVYRGFHPQEPEAIAQYKELLGSGLVRPSVMELYVMNADGTGKRQITKFGAASFAPFFHPDGHHIIFASNKNDPKGRNFDLFLINDDGTGLEQITFNETFDGFPIFNADGTKLVFCSNRHSAVRGETNVFIADWVP